MKVDKLINTVLKPLPGQLTDEVDRSPARFLATLVTSEREELVRLSDNNSRSQLKLIAESCRSDSGSLKVVDKAHTGCEHIRLKMMIGSAPLNALINKLGQGNKRNPGVVRALTCDACDKQVPEKTPHVLLECEAYESMRGEFLLALDACGERSVFEGLKVPAKCAFILGGPVAETSVGESANDAGAKFVAELWNKRCAIRRLKDGALPPLRLLTPSKDKHSFPSAMNRKSKKLSSAADAARTCPLPTKNFPLFNPRPVHSVITPSHTTAPFSLLVVTNRVEVGSNGHLSTQST